MEIKHRECFCPAFIDRFDLQGVARYAREAWDFVNLHSQSRGCNRFIALILTLDLLRVRREVRERGAAIPGVETLRDWVGRESALGQPALEAEIVRRGEAVEDTAELRRALLWSIDVNAAVEKIVRNISPFPLVREVLAAAGERAELRVVSQTPRTVIEREWREGGILPLVEGILGQEEGSKKRQLETAALHNYDKRRVLMVGDTLGDLEAARANHVLFFPILPGQERESWLLFHVEALERFFEGRYAGKYEESLVEAFEAGLPDSPPWLI